MLELVIVPAQGTYTVMVVLPVETRLAKSIASLFRFVEVANTPLLTTTGFVPDGAEIRVPSVKLVQATGSPFALEQATFDPVTDTPLTCVESVHVAH